MRFIFVLFLIFAISLMAMESPADLCTQDCSVDSTSIETHHDETSEESNSSSSSHEAHHCPVHCMHMVCVLRTESSLDFVTFSLDLKSSYHFFNPQVHLEGPFRPPLA